LSPRNKYIVAGEGDGFIVVIDRKMQKSVRRFRAHKGSIFALSVSPDNLFIASGAMTLFSSLPAFKIWDLQKGVPIKEFSKNDILKNRGHGFVVSLDFKPFGMEKENQREVLERFEFIKKTIPEKKELSIKILETELGSMPIVPFVRELKKNN